MIRWLLKSHTQCFVLNEIIISTNKTLQIKDELLKKKKRKYTCRHNLVGPLQKEHKNQTHYIVLYLNKVVIYHVEWLQFSAEYSTNQIQFNQ